MGLAPMEDQQLIYPFLQTYNWCFSDPQYFRNISNASHLEQYYSTKLIDKLGIRRIGHHWVVFIKTLQHQHKKH